MRADLIGNTELMTAAIARAVRQAVWEHARLGFAVPSWENGKFVWISPAEILAQVPAPEEKSK